MDDKKKQTREDVVNGFKNDLSAKFKDLAGKHEAVWQGADLEKVSMPVAYPLQGDTVHAFQGGNAVILMQAQKELGTADPRWVFVPQDLNKLKDVGIVIKKGSHLTNLIVHTKDGKEYIGKVVNMSQCFAKVKHIVNLPSGNKRTAPEMLKAMAKQDLGKVDFFTAAKESYKAGRDSVHVMNKEFVTRAKAIESFNVEKPTGVEDTFMQACKKYMYEGKDYVHRAVADLMISQKFKDASIIKAVNKLAPGAAFGFNYAKKAVEGCRKNNKDVKKALAGARA